MSNYFTEAITNKVGGVRVQTNEDNKLAYLDVWEYGKDKQIIKSVGLNGLGLAQLKDIQTVLSNAIAFLQGSAQENGDKNESSI